MTLVQRFGRLDLFIIMTCSPNWEEFKRELLPGQTPQDRPDLLTRVFRAKLDKLKEDINGKGVLGTVVAYAYVIEFQKRGLPHMHMLVVLDENDKLNNPDDYDQIVKAEIPNEHEEPQLYNVFVDARWVCAPEALLRIFKFVINRIYPIVERLQIHLPNMHQVRFQSDQIIENTLTDERLNKTMLIEFFTLNRNDAEAGRYLYREIPEHYRWICSERGWSKRKNHLRVIGRIYTVSPAEGEKFYLRILLNHVRGATSFLNLMTVGGVLQPTFKEVAEQQVLLEGDDSIQQCLLEASTIQMSSALRRLFVTILVYCGPVGVRTLWDEFYPCMIEDYAFPSNLSCNVVVNRLLRDLNTLLVQFSKNIKDYNLPQMTTKVVSAMPRCIEDELSIGGTGKTYLYCALLENLRRLGHIVLATATSGIAATILPGGRTAHSRFKIPLSPDSSSTCSISKQSDLAKLIQKAKAIIWDEATMTHHHAFEALDRTFRDIIDVDLPFGGKTMIFGGDFRQVLPVIPKGTKSKLIQASVVKASFWSQVKILKLRQNMRSKNDQQFSQFLLRVGDGEEPVVGDDMTRVPECLVIPWENELSINEFIYQVFPNLEDHINDASYMVERVVITLTNEDVDMVERAMYSFDLVEDDTRNLNHPEFLNSICIGGLPPHKLTLKRGAPVMLLRNIDPKLRLCNGTRLLCRGSYQNLIDAEILTGQSVGTRVFLPRKVEGHGLTNRVQSGLVQCVNTTNDHNKEYVTVLLLMVVHENSILTKLNTRMQSVIDMFQLSHRVGVIQLQ
ncbi:uncharacterized protein LOC110772138 [Prunus avium]|uniref:ATP-dependent DNA helicase n=1 Tax=Prunus avium TaxID=42229 RepID=A0A6P5TWR3_PRUAV|nr:uncharacterized protein LOC110772138 [Prunus avium]